MNQRNGDYILKYNKRAFYPLVDDKVRTKELALKENIPVPEQYGVIKTEHDIRGLDEIVKGKADFVIKPANGAGGDGILVIVERRSNEYRRASGVWVNRDAIAHHISNILSGMYSLGGRPDRALIEYRIKFDPVFQPISNLGVPDIRTVVFRGFPVMAMTRLPTRASDGKANLHQGAVGVGIDITSGQTTYGVLRNRLVTHHPDTDNPLAGLQIPEWQALLQTVARCYEMTNLGYLGVDMVLDAQRGPLILELNARPGLSIQLANQTGLLSRLQHIEQQADPALLPAARVAYAQQAFRDPSRSVA